jgi:hypothetical protein
MTSGSPSRIATVLVGTKADQYLQRRVEWDDVYVISRNWDVPLHEVNTANSVADVIKSLVREVCFIRPQGYAYMQFLVIGKHGVGRSSFINKAGELVATCPTPPGVSAAPTFEDQPEIVRAIIGHSPPKQFTITVD